jgi:hypothetical protein
MGNSIEYINIGITEDSIHTIKVYKAKIPNADGATQVLIKDVEIDCDVPENIAGADGSVVAGLQICYDTPTNCNLSNTKAIISQKQTRYADNSPSGNGPQSKENLFLPVDKHSDGSYYVTLSVMGSSNQTIVKNAWCFASFMVYR